MNLLKFFFIICFSPLLSVAKQKNDVGFSVGASYYMGDYNMATQFYMPSPAIGVMFRHNFNEFYAIRVSGSHGHLKGSYSQSKHLLHNLPAETSFSHQIAEIATSLEIGFRPFGTKPIDAHKFSPFVSVGVGAAYIDRKFVVHFPFGIGIKYTPFNRWTFGAQWQLHKTFTDNIDGYSNVTSIERLRIHNYDWIGIGGIFVSYRLVNKGAICPVYN